jgi:hypothetical protein
MSGSQGREKRRTSRCALAHQACRRGYRAYYRRASRLFDDLKLARADGTYGRLLGRLGRMDVLVVDDWGLAPPQDQERRDLLEILARSTIVTSQLPPAQWHDHIADPTLADAICDRLPVDRRRNLRSAEAVSHRPPRSRDLRQTRISISAWFRGVAGRHLSPRPRRNTGWVKRSAHLERLGQPGLRPSIRRSPARRPRAGHGAATRTGWPRPRRPSPSRTASRTSRKRRRTTRPSTRRAPCRPPGA